MTKQELVAELAERAELSRAKAGEVIDLLFGTEGILSTELLHGRKVLITGFGNFEARQRAARTGRDPRTGNEIAIPASVAPVFRPGKPLKDLLKGPRA